MTCSVKALLERRFNQVSEMFAAARERLLDNFPPAHKRSCWHSLMK
jgi:hypothetical protein